MRKCKLLVIFTLQNFHKFFINLKTGAVLKPNYLCFDILKMLAFHGFKVKQEHCSDKTYTFQMGKRRHYNSEEQSFSFAHSKN